ncbi:restriction endonuclease subunit S [Deinococcus seoulensis]|uniref:restriction endonuclease subunit S n=1 Tax=Deinococcus seoulensis TaxID=1837379 RepID=UPI001E5E7FEA|nr:restriction endonuclease subunit S [Deinococcus seoulensis]
MSERKADEQFHDLRQMEDLPAGWATTNVGAITINFDSKRIPIKSEERRLRRGVYPYYGASGIIDKIDGFIFDGVFLLVAEDGANLISRSTPIAFKAEGKFWVNNHAHIIQLSERMPLSTLENYLNSIDLSPYVTGSAQPKLTQAALASIQLPLPPLLEQIRIADKLDALLARVEAGRERLERVPKLLKRFRQSVLSAAVSGELTREWRGGGEAEYPRAVLNEVVAEPLRNGRSVRDGDGGKVLRLSALHNNGLLWEASKTGDWTGLDHSKYIVQEGDFLISRGNGSLDLVARGSLAIGAPGDVAFPDTMIRIRPDADRLRPSFLNLAWQSDDVRRQVTAIAKTTAGIWKVSQGDLEKVTVRLPSLDEQNEIVRRTEALFSIADRIEAKYAAALSSFDRLTPALLAKAFRGELVPQDPNDEPASVLLERIRAAREAEGGKRGRGRPAKAAAGSGDGAEVKRRGHPPGANAQAGVEGTEPKRRGRPPKVRAAVSEPDAQPAAVPEAVEASAAPRGRGRPPGPGIPQASSFEDALRRLEEQKLVRTQGTRQVGLFGDTED